MMDFYKGKKVLITGNTGFKGSWLTQTLIKLGADVTGIGLAPDTDPSCYDALRLNEKVRENIVDVRDYDDLLEVFLKTQPEIVFHLAAQPLVIRSYHDPRYTYEVNAMGTVNVCDCIRMTNSVRSFVNVTTDKVYRNNEWEYPYREIDYLDGYDPYSNSKSCSELITATYTRAFFKERDIAVSTCRAGNVIGGGDFSKNRIIPDCFRECMSHKQIELRNPDAVRPYQHVLEAVFFYLMVAKKQFDNNEYSGAYNVGPKYTDCISTKDIAQLFCRFWGMDASWSDVLYEGPHEAGLLRLDTSKAKSVFYWEPVWDVRQAVKETVNWYKTFSKGGDVIGLTMEQIDRYTQLCGKWWNG